MGLLNDITGYGTLYSGLLGNFGGGIAIQPSQLAAMQQQQRMSDPFAFQGQQILQTVMPYYPFRPTKCVESREVTPRERARKQINGAAQAVKDAQIAAKNLNET